ncbi:MAG: ferritin-like domain-containing protein, partial [Alphaproteobacteria bacterium]|nr:ferritin-like domain-containing protein [Alphaproteobacteria bacterium]
RAFYAMYVDMDELKGEGERMVGDDIAEAGIQYLQSINFTSRSGAKLLAAE